MQFEKSENYLKNIRVNSGPVINGIADFVQGTAIVLTQTGQTITINASGGAFTDELVKVSAVDTTAGYLASKLLAGSGISLIASGVGNETLTVANTGVLSETDPIFNAWLIATPPLYSETDPVFNAWLIATPPLYSEVDPLSLHLDQTAPQTFTGGAVTGTGLLKVTAGLLGLDTTAYVSGTPWTAMDYLINNIGRVGNTTLIGGTTASGTLTLSSTSNGTKGKILFGTSAYDEVNNRLGIGNASPTVGLELGSETAGQSETINATLGGELITSPMVAGGWTLGYDAGVGGWAIAGGVLSKTTSTNTLTAIATTGMTSAPTAGVTYKVVVVVSAASGTTLPSLGGQAITSITAPGTYTEYLTALTNGKIQFSSVAASTITITSISIKALSTTDGILTVNGNIKLMGSIISEAGNASINYDPNGFLRFRNGASYSPIYSGAVISNSYLSGTSVLATAAISTSQAIATTSADGFVSQPSAAALVGAPVRMSPRIRLTGYAWNTTPTAASNSINFIEEVLPVSGATTSGSLNWSYQNNGAAYSELMRLTSGGNVGIGAAPTLGRLHIQQAGNTVNSGLALMDSTVNYASYMWTDASGLLRLSAGIIESRAILLNGGGVGNVGIGVVAPTAALHLKAGTTAASTAPLKFTSGTSLITAEAGAMEFTTDDLYFTITTGVARKNIALWNTLGTIGQVPYVSTNGRLLGQTPVANGTYTMGLKLTGGGVDGTITITNGIITAIQQAT